MAGLEVLGVSAFTTLTSVFLLLLLFAVLRSKPINDRVYFPKLYIAKKRTAHDAHCPRRSINLYNCFSWIPDALRMSQNELIEHAGLDSVVFLRIYILGFKIFLPIMVVALLVLIPVNVSGGEINISGINKLSILNVRSGSKRFFFHIFMAYAFTFWTCLMLYKEYSNVSFMRLHFLASQKRSVHQFMVIVRNIPAVSYHSISETVHQFFSRHHPDHYIGQQVVYKAKQYAKLVKRKERLQKRLNYYQLMLEMHPYERPIGRTKCFGFCGEEVDLIDYYRAKIIKLDNMMASERERVLSDPKAIMPAVFLKFDSRRGAAVCAQTQQSRNPNQWITDWAPEPRDVYWENLAIPFISLSIRKFLIPIALFILIFIYMIPITLVNALFNLETIEKIAPFVRPIKEVKVVKSFVEGFLPNIALNLFLKILQVILMIMSKAEGHISLSSLERKTASKYYYFMVVNVFIGSMAAGMVLEQSFLEGFPSKIASEIGLVVAVKATFFMTYIMVDGWAGIANEILRLIPLIKYHVKIKFIVKTERDRERAMDPGSIELAKTLPSLQLYFLVGLVYAVVAPILLPFLILFFIFAFIAYRNQIINVYDQKYESAAAFWPQMHSRIIANLLICHITLFALLSPIFIYSVPLLVILSLLTIWFHKYCKSRFEPAFRKYPLEEATERDDIEKILEPSLNLNAYLENAYLQPIFRRFEQQDQEEEGAHAGQT